MWLILQNTQNIEPASALFRGEESAYFAGDYRLAACWLLIGAQKNEPASQGLLANLYYQGLGVSQDYAQAFHRHPKYNPERNWHANGLHLKSGNYSVGDCRTIAECTYTVTQSK